MDIKKGDPLLRIENISKSFFNIKVLDSVSFDINRGEVNAIIGENGAGKSTLMKIISGALKPDNGNLYLDGKIVFFNSPVDAQKSAISIIYQELTVFNNMTGAENVFAGREFSKYGFVNRGKAEEKTKKILESLKPDLDCTIPLSKLSPAEKQIIQIARALSIDSKIIIMDEPSASLSSGEVNALFEIIRKLKNKHISIIYITHRIEEVYRISDRVHVLRDGKYIGCVETKKAKSETLIFMMTGKKFKDLYYKENLIPKKVILDIRALSKKDSFQNISFKLHESEILGITGLIGAQKTELARAIFGLDKVDDGEIFFNNEKVNINSPLKAIRLGIGFIAEDRQSQILFPLMDVVFNITITLLNNLSKFGFIDFFAARRVTEDFISKFKIIPRDPERKVKTFSGGNQQKIAIARWVSLHPKILILDEPTRGVDVSSRRDIYKMISSIAKENSGIIVISSDLSEIINISNKIIVMHHGKIKAYFDSNEISEDNLRNLL